MNTVTSTCDSFITEQTQFDSPWKNILQQFLQAFMEFCLPKAAANIDWSKGYTSLDKELQAISRQQEIGKRMADVLFKVWLQDGEEVWLLVHIEIQAQVEALFPERMYIYNYRIFDRYHQPAMSVAVLADDDPNWRPRVYQRSTWYSQLHFEFASIKLLDYSDQKAGLSQQDNPFAIVIWAHLEALKTRQHPKNRLLAKLMITRALYKCGFSKNYILNLLSFIDWVLALPEPLEIQYIQDIEQLEEEKHVNYVTSFERIGIKKGIQQGIQQGEAALFIELLQYRFKIIPPEYQYRIEQADPKILLQWGKRILEAKTLEEVFED